MRTTDSQGRPLRYVPRQPNPLAPPAVQPGASLSEPCLPPLPLAPPIVAPEARDLESAILLANSLRSALLRLGWVQEEG